MREPVFLQRLLDDSGDLMVDVLLDAGTYRSIWIGFTVRQRERQMKVAAVQMSAPLADVDHNLERAGALLERASTSTSTTSPAPSNAGSETSLQR